MEGSNEDEPGRRFPITTSIRDKTCKQILIATDGSKASEKAADFGIEIAYLSRAKVYAVYVINVTSQDYILMDATWTTETREKFEKIGREATAYVVAQAAGLEAEAVILKGNPAEKIIDFAEEHEVDMIVVGSLGKSGIERFMTGSVAEKVFRNAKVPVLVVR
jgi:nucleotide-binding universal stress UspA family protein